MKHLCAVFHADSFCLHHTALFFYNYSRKQITEDAIDHAHGTAAQHSCTNQRELQIV